MQDEYPRHEKYPGHEEYPGRKEYSGPKFYYPETPNLLKRRFEQQQEGYNSPNYGKAEIRTGQDSALQDSMVRHSTLHMSAVQCSTAKHRAVQCWGWGPGLFTVSDSKKTVSDKL